MVKVFRIGLPKTHCFDVNYFEPKVIETLQAYEELSLEELKLGVLSIIRVITRTSYDLSIEQGKLLITERVPLSSCELPSSPLKPQGVLSHPELRMPYISHFPFLSLNLFMYVEFPYGCD